MEVQNRFQEIFSEIDSPNKRLSELGREAKPILGQLINSGVPLDLVTPFLAKARKAEKAALEEEVQPVKDRRRYIWWNSGFCKKNNGCSFSHQISDCQDRLQGGCNIKRCNTLRHRKVCKFFLSKEGCHRGDTCAYLHTNKDVEVELEANESEIHEIEGVGPDKEVAVPERDLAAVDDKEFKEKEIKTEFES